MVCLFVFLCFFLPRDKTSISKVPWERPGNPRSNPGILEQVRCGPPHSSSNVSSRQAQRKSPCVSGPLLLHSPVEDREASWTDTGHLPGAESPIKVKEVWDSQTPQSHSAKPFKATLWGVPAPGDSRFLSSLCAELFGWLCCQSSG